MVFPWGILPINIYNIIAKLHTNTGGRTKGVPPVFVWSLALIFIYPSICFCMNLYIDFHLSTSIMLHCYLLQPFTLNFIFIYDYKWRNKQPWTTRLFIAVAVPQAQSIKSKISEGICHCVCYRETKRTWNHNLSQITLLLLKVNRHCLCVY